MQFDAISDLYADNHPDAMFAGSHNNRVYLTSFRPQIDSINPSSAINDSIIQLSWIKGFNFDLIDYIGITDVKAAIECTNIVIVDDTELTCDLDIVGAYPGQYDLEIRTDLGIGVKEDGFTVICTNPEAAFSANIFAGETPFEVQFTNDSTTYSGCTEDQWAWNFGDGGASTLEDPTHEYTVAGVYDVALTATGPGGPDTETKADYITVVNPPNADFYGTPTTLCEDSAVQFSDLSTDYDTLAWDFGDGGSSTATDPSHAYANAGPYTVALVATGPFSSDIETKSNYIIVEAIPAIDFSASPTSSCPGNSIPFTSTGSGQVSSYAWDFGDSGTSSQANPAHTYSSPGTYTVSVTATGNCGNDTESKTDYISIASPPTADFEADTQSACTGDTVSFTDLTAGTATAWFWSFGDGDTSTAQNPTHVYDQSGTYAVSLTATGPCGSDTESKTGYVVVKQTPTSEFHANQTVVCIGNGVQFIDDSTGDIDSYAWIFGDGGTSAIQNPTHNYSTAGTYTVSLTTSGDCGDDTETKPEFVTVNGAPTAQFSADPTEVTVGETVNFTDESTGSVSSWLWNFGDGGQSLLRKRKLSMRNFGKMLYLMDTYAWVEYFLGSKMGDQVKALFEKPKNKFITMETDFGFK